MRIVHFDSAGKRPASDGRLPDDAARAMAFYGEAFGIMHFDASAA
jgi:hypothetical protein